MKRISPIAGSWYEGEAVDLKRQIENLFLNSQFGPGIDMHNISSKPNESQQLIGVISPHAGYIYSGSIASWSYLTLKENFPSLDTCIILGPNHRGLGPHVSIFPKGVWEYPNCSLRIDEDLTSYLQEMVIEKQVEYIEFESSAHLNEHSIDIQGPILGELYGNSLKIIPICIKRQSLEVTEILSELIFRLLKKFPEKKIAIVASSDLSHEEDNSKLERNDKIIIRAIEQGDPDAVNQFRLSENITMCGYGPVLTLMKLTNRIGDPNYVTLKYANSHQIRPGGSYTVGYLSSGCYVSK